MSQNLEISNSLAASKNRDDTADKEYLKRKSSRQSSARYRLHHCEELLEAERLHADLKTTKDPKAIALARQRAREASAQYRKRNREALTLKQREVRRRKFVVKHGYRKFFLRALEAGASLFLWDVGVADLVGVYFLWIARVQTEGYTNSMQKGFRTWNEAEEWWRARCIEKHGDICPDFEPVQFTLHVPSSTHPSSNPCSYSSPGQYPAAPARAAPPAPVILTTAPSPFCTPSVSTGSSSTSLKASMSPLTPTPIKTEPASPTPTIQREATSLTLHLTAPNRITPLTHVHLTASGRVHPTQAGAAPADAAVNPVTPRTHGNAVNPAPSVMVTPAADAPAPVPGPAPEVPMYGIRGVAVFYHSHTEARVAAASLGLVNPKIMVSSNTSKLEAWMLGKPFVGEDN
ncbi:hypothetical protein K438DRAFT_1997807 [Mycena galopus ATCC 62051]|nr:hypothetical protein K438DRAFT_1997807 [Mycena galopus ATCC 62051]